MKSTERISGVLLSLLLAAGIGSLLKPSQAGGQDGEAQCAKPAGAKCGDKTIIVHADGLHGGDDETFACEGDKLDWQVDGTDAKMTDFTIHFDESPFDSNFGSGDYCAGKHCSGHESGTDKLVAHAKTHGPGYVRCHRYNLTVVQSDGSKVPIDPHIIVGTAGSSQ
jgi:hypothetical protein